MHDYGFRSIGTVICIFTYIGISCFASPCRCTARPGVPMCRNPSSFGQLFRHFLKTWILYNVFTANCVFECRFFNLFQRFVLKDVHFAVFLYKSYSCIRVRAISDACKCNVQCAFSFASDFQRVVIGRWNKIRYIFYKFSSEIIFCLHGRDGILGTCMPCSAQHCHACGKYSFLYIHSSRFSILISCKFLCFHRNMFP